MQKCVSFEPGTGAMSIKALSAYIFWKILEFLLFCENPWDG